MTRGPLKLARNIEEGDKKETSSHRMDTQYYAQHQTCHTIEAPSLASGACLALYPA